MTRVLVTGGTGSLGREVVSLLLAAGHTVRIMSRRRCPIKQPSKVEWAQADLSTGIGLADAVHGSDVIIHAATQPFGKTYQVDVRGTRWLLEQARTAGVSHVVYISIVGIDHIPFSYYRHKRAAEALVQHCESSWVILRATQFHSLIDRALRTAARFPIMLLPTDFQCQPIDPGEVADRVCAAVIYGETGHLADIGGPEVLSIGDMAQSWLAAQRVRKRVRRLPLPGKIARAFRAGYNTCPNHPAGHITWLQWLQQSYGGPGA